MTTSVVSMLFFLIFAVQISEILFYNQYLLLSKINIMKKKLLITYAVKEEFIPISFPDYEISYLHTGIGKARSAMLLTQAVMSNKPDAVLNMGTSGTLAHSVGDIFTCLKFVDRDYLAVHLPGVAYEIDCTSLSLTHSLISQLVCEEQKQGVCSTGDTFVTEISSLKEDVVDMESYAQALVCTTFEIPFVSVKYVTDIIGQNSIRHWEKKLADARIELDTWFKEKSALIN